jgi:acyl-CoA synthetase (AMP-forming)/AMP-acid ligase II
MITAVHIRITMLQSVQVYFHTGDIGIMHPDGALQIVDRKKDLIKLEGGEYVSLGKVESKLKEVKGIGACVVFARSDKKYCVAIVSQPEKGWASLGEAHLTNRPAVYRPNKRAGLFVARAPARHVTLDVGDNVVCAVELGSDHATTLCVTGCSVAPTREELLTLIPATLRKLGLPKFEIPQDVQVVRCLRCVPSPISCFARAVG